MAIELGLETLVTNIAALNISGVTIKDLDAIPEEVTNRDKQILIPKPDGFVTGFNLERASLSTGASGQWDVRYSITYRYLHSLIASGRGLFDLYPSFVAKAVLIINAIMENDGITGVEDFTFRDIQNFGPIMDPLGNVFHGCDFVFDVLELIN